VFKQGGIYILKNNLLSRMSAVDDEVLLAKGFDHCVVGMTLREEEWVALYNASLVVKELSKDMPYEDAMEFFEFNVQGAYMGPKTPIFIFMDQDSDA